MANSMEKLISFNRKRGLLYMHLSLPSWNKSQRITAGEHSCFTNTHSCKYYILNACTSKCYMTKLCVARLFAFVTDVDRNRIELRSIERRCRSGQSRGELKCGSCCARKLLKACMRYSKTEHNLSRNHNRQLKISKNVWFIGWKKVSNSPRYGYSGNSAKLFGQSGIKLLGNIR